MSLDLLPDHTILDILDCLLATREEDEDKYAFLHVSQCSKRLNILATPYVYRDIELDSWDREVLLMKTLFKFPKLGMFCKTLTCCRNPWAPEGDRLLDDNEITFYKQRIEQVCIEPDQVTDWLYRRLSTKSWEASAALVLSSIPNVEKICLGRLNDTDDWLWDPLKLVLDHAATLQSQGNINSSLALSRLSAVECSFPEPARLEELLPFLRLGSVKTAELDPTFDDIESEVGKADIDLDSLVLGAIVDSSGSPLTHFFQNFRTLRSLRIREDDGGADPYYESNPHTLDEALSGLKHCLEELAIDQFARPDEDSPWLSSLTEFERLSRVSITAAVLFKPNHGTRQNKLDWLPKSLEWLELIDYNQYAVDQLILILREREELVPKLKHIQFKRRQIFSRRGERSEDHPELQRTFGTAIGYLKTLCKDAGIVLDYYEEPEVMAVDNHSTVWKLVDWETRQSFI